MSSLFQFNGKVDKRGVHLEFYQTTPRAEEHLKDSEGCGNYTDGIFLPGGKFLPRIWTCVRKPKGMFGCWVVFRYNGQDHVPDLSCPQGLFKLPRDARPMPVAECIARWAK